MSKPQAAKVSYLAVYSDDPRRWKPEQLLREMLSQIERGDLKSDKLLVVWNNFNEEYPNGLDPGMVISGCTALEALGLLHLASAHIDEALRGVVPDDE